MCVQKKDSGGLGSGKFCAILHFLLTSQQVAIKVILKEKVYGWSKVSTNKRCETWACLAVIVWLYYIPGVLCVSSCRQLIYKLSIVLFDHVIAWS